MSLSIKGICMGVVLKGEEEYASQIKGLSRQMGLKEQ